MTELRTLRAERSRVLDSLEAVNRLYYARGWTDGLPIVPPTEERVWEMLDHWRADHEEIFGPVPPKRGIATMENVAINAVMAGCLPQYLPVIVTALRAMLEPEFNLFGIQATTHPVAPLVIVNGPLAKELDLNSGYGCFGPGWRANATIGRAMRLILMNLGGGVPGKLDRSTAGQPAKYAYCIAENEDENPWEPLHVERGFGPQTSSVTVVGAEGPHNINDHGSISGAGILTTVAGSMTKMGSNNIGFQTESLVALSPEHAATVARDGFSKADVKRFLFEKAQIPLSRFAPDNVQHYLAPRWPNPLREACERWLREGTTGAMIPIVGKPEDLIIIVAGGAGKHSAYIPTFGATQSVTKPIPQKASA